MSIFNNFRCWLHNIVMEGNGWEKTSLTEEQLYQQKLLHFYKSKHTVVSYLECHTDTWGQNWFRYNLSPPTTF